MVRKALVVGIIAATMIIGLAGAALAAPPAMTLSSFEPTAVDGVIVGGVRTITVTNLLNEPLDAHTVDLGQAPCDCVVSGITGGTGDITDDLWSVGTLAPGETATVTFSYGQGSSTVASSTGSVNAALNGTALFAGFLISLLGLTGAVGTQPSGLRQATFATA
ncbi:MAG: hypothetical protein O3B42_07305 [Actinomycetota bacterium]|nr:hypothetical protein [Actinomycetota bacterium]